MEFTVRCIVLFSLLILWVSDATAESSVVNIGDAREQVIEALGEPSGALNAGSIEILTFNGANIRLRDGKVIEIDEDFSKKQASDKDKQALAKQMREKGYLEYKGRWFTKSQLDEFKKSERANRLKNEGGNSKPDFKDYRLNGANIALPQILAPGKITMVDFYADWCGPCKKMEPELKKIIASDSDIALRKVDIVNWNTPIVKQFQIRSIPNVWVFDKKGRLVGEPTSSMSRIVKYLKAAKKS
ncbi:MAG: thioredoxin domain-containing protein [Verrucomicrobiota bacterium]